MQKQRQSCTNTQYTAVLHCWHHPHKTGKNLPMSAFVCTCLEWVRMEFVLRHLLSIRPTAWRVCRYQLLSHILSKKSYNLDSEHYMAKACAYLCRQCCFIDGFSEFGNEFSKYTVVKTFWVVICPQIWPSTSIGVCKLAINNVCQLTKKSTQH